MCVELSALQIRVRKDTAASQPETARLIALIVLLVAHHLRESCSIHHISQLQDKLVSSQNATLEPLRFARNHCFGLAMSDVMNWCMKVLSSQGSPDEAPDLQSMQLLQGFLQV